MTGFSRSAGLLCLLLACFLASSDALIHEKYRNLCGGSPLIQRKHEKTLQWLVKNVGEGALAISTSPQNKAACWMFRENKKFTAQRFALGVFYFGTKGTMWEINTDWMSDKHECSWYGITCSYFKTVLGLDLGFIKVDGVIPRELGLLTSLREIDLHGNDLQGVIPHKMMFGLKKLESLRLHMNGFFGAFHKEITNMSNLKEISMFGNYMGGTIPKELASLKKLEIIDFYANMLTGTIPKDLAKLPNLRVLDLHDNNLVGTMPKEICDRKLDVLISDCYGRNPEVKCECCTICCEGLPTMFCVDTKTGERVDRV